MAQPQQTSSLPPSNQLKELREALETAKRLFGTPKDFTRLAIENPSEAVLVAEAARKMTGPLREIQTLAR